MNKDDFERTLHFGEAAMDLLKKAEIPPTPRFYELLYTYASGVNRRLNKRINQLFRQGLAPDRTMADSLCREFLRSSDVEERLDSVSTEIATRIDAVHGAIDHAAASANSYSGLLQSARGDLEGDMNGKSVKALTSGLLRETRKMQTANTMLEKRLETARDDVHALQCELEEVRRESLLDPLTNIHNRKSFDRRIESAVREAEESGEELSLLLIDIDHFKQFNDRFGHQTGDQVLSLVASTLSSGVRDTDLSARYGGEEFAAILPATSLAKAKKLAERLRKAIQSKELLKRSTNEKLGRVTASFGVATFRSSDTSMSLIERADNCLYAAKNEGRNCVVTEDSKLMLEQSGSHYAA